MSSPISMILPERATTDSNHSSLKSAIGRLCRKLSQRKKAPKSPAEEKMKEESCLSASDVEEEDASQARYSGELRRVFGYIDEDGDGRISPSELQNCVCYVRGGEGNLSQEEAEIAVRSSDSDGDGLLGFDDFAKMMEASASEEEKTKEIREAFGMYEMEGTGCITPVSLKRMLSRLGQSTTIDNCRTMIRCFDLNGDGVIDFDEFSRMMR